MKAATQQLQDFLMSGAPAGLVDLITFTLTPSGSVLRYTTWDRDLTVGGHLFSAQGPFFKSSGITEKIGLETTSLTLDVIAMPNHQVLGMPVLAAIASGVFDGAAVVLDRAILDPASNFSVVGTIKRFVGTVGDVSEVASTRAKLQVNSRLEILNQPFPRTLYSPGCRHTLFDDGCTLNRADFISHGVVAAASNKGSIATNLSQPGAIAPPASGPTLSAVEADGCNLSPRTYWVVATYVTAAGETIASIESHLDIPANQVLRVASPGSVTGVTGWNVYVGIGSGDEQKQNGSPLAIGTAWTEAAAGVVQGAPPPQASSSGYFEEGVMTFTSGQNAGQSRRVVYQQANVLVVIPLFPYVPQIGDAFDVIPGCNKMLSTCRFKFDNDDHFGGAPFMPQPESAI